MKKFIITILFVFMVLSLFACGNETVDPIVSPTSNNENVDVSTPSPTQEPDEVDNEKDPNNNLATTEPIETESTNTESTNTNSNNKPEDINPVASSKESPAKIGDWLETKKYSAVDKEYHTVYYRITDIIRYNDEVQSELDAWNNSGSIRVFEPLENDVLEYCLIKYETYFPEEFPQQDWGITSTDIRFSITSPTGGGIKANGKAYIGLSSVYDISRNIEINEFYAGETFKDGKAVFAMVKGVSDYVIETSYRPDDGETEYNYVEGK